MPDAFQTMTARPHNDRRGLSANCTPVQIRQIVGHDLQRVQNVIEVLDFTNWAQTAHRHADRLPKDCHLADTGVGHAQRAVLFLHALETLVHVTEETNILAKRDDARVAS